MKPDLDVAATLECEPELLPYLPEILQDFDALGSDPARLIELLETQGVADEIHTGLDICSGKGATSIALAKRSACTSTASMRSVRSSNPPERPRQTRGWMSFVASPQVISAPP